jgi:hypothetical protein
VVKQEGINPPVTRLEQKDPLVGKQEGIRRPVTKLEQQDPLVAKQEGINLTETLINWTSRNEVANIVSITAGLQGELHNV